jgi:hypothetical protein
MKLLIPLHIDEIERDLKCLYCDDKNNLCFAIVFEIGNNNITITTSPTEPLTTIAHTTNYPIGKYLFRIKAMDL